MDNSIVPVITIDGPVGSGKSVLAHRLVNALSWHYLDSGALYRIVAMVSMRMEIPIDDIDALVAQAAELDVTFELPEEGGYTRVFWAGEEITDAIRTESISQRTSKISSHGALREALTQTQKRFRQLPGLVTDGRDMGTVIFPDATFKFFLTASAKSRAMRRVKQLHERGKHANLPDVLADLMERDARDQSRSAAPLKAADDAVVIDTSSKTIDEVFAMMIGIVEAEQ